MGGVFTFAPEPEVITSDPVEDVPVARSAALIEEALNASTASSEPEPEVEAEPEDVPAVVSAPAQTTRTLL